MLYLGGKRGVFSEVSKVISAGMPKINPLVPGHGELSVIFGIAILKFNSNNIGSDKEIKLIVYSTTKLKLILQSAICPKIINLQYQMTCKDLKM